MKANRFRAGLFLFTFAALVSGAGAAEGLLHRPAVCEPGYQIVEEVCYQDVISKVCHSVPDVKKVSKTVYTQKPVDYCEPHCHLHHDKSCDGCASCADCGRVRTKCLLVKRTVVEECPTTKCVVETTVKRVPYTVYHKVPCTPATAVPEPCLPGSSTPQFTSPVSNSPLPITPAQKN